MNTTQRFIVRRGLLPLVAGLFTGYVISLLIEMIQNRTVKLVAIIAFSLTVCAYSIYSVIKTNKEVKRIQKELEQYQRALSRYKQHFENRP